MLTNYFFTRIVRFSQSIALAAMLCACASSQNSNEFRRDQFVGTWSSGMLHSGTGAYFEESFLPDGTYCALSVDVDESLAEVRQGTWDFYDGMLTVKSIAKYPSRRMGDSGDESREIEFIKQNEFGYRFRPLPVIFQIHRIDSHSANGKWCARATEDTEH